LSAARVSVNFVDLLPRDWLRECYRRRRSGAAAFRIHSPSDNASELAIAARPLDTGATGGSEVSLHRVAFVRAGVGLEAPVSAGAWQATAFDRATADGSAPCSEKEGGEQ
jgi:hypothetical protein